MARAIQKSEEDGLILDHYRKQGGLVKNGEMVNRSKKSTAQLWFREQIKSGEFVMENDISGVRTKTDEELQNIMRESIDNSYVPSSIYHKAKQELEFRNMDKTNKEHVAVNMTKSAKNNVFINSQINGQLKLEGQGNKFTKTNIGVPRIDKKSWYEKPLGQVIIGIIILIVGTAVITFLGWS